MHLTAPDVGEAVVGVFENETVRAALLVIGIIVLAFIAYFLFRIAIRKTVTQIVSGVKRKVDAADTEAIQSQNSPLTQVRIVQRTRTIGTVLNTLSAWSISVVTIIVCLAIVGVSPSALVAAAGLFGAAVGIGAQNLLKDILNGLFMVFEDQLGVGDLVDLGPATGVVESVGIRVTQIRDVDGTLWFVRNGEIIRVGNMSQGWARAIIDLGVPYETDISIVEDKMLEVANALSRDPKWRNRIIDQPELWGIESISATAVVIRLVVKTRPNAKFDVARELRGRLRLGLDEIGVTLPALNSIVLTGMEGNRPIKSGRASFEDQAPQ
ncbi:mechanosensitive ion channel family protein [Humidisolicoccus flavus]|uniref:mechanosensitive ion channel family protein n=1 Tax=Humidisolicoccus flavus TaxID=3111414 RepID=UPI003249DF16